MNKTSIFLFSALLVALLSGCGSALKEINAKSLSTRSDVFVEIKNDEAIPSGYSDVIIKVSIKTPPTGYYLWESKRFIFWKTRIPLRI